MDKNIWKKTDKFWYNIFLNTYILVIKFDNNINYIIMFIILIYFSYLLFIIPNLIMNLNIYFIRELFPVIINYYFKWGIIFMIIN
jgi:hypothetical protein